MKQETSQFEQDADNDQGLMRRRAALVTAFQALPTHGSAEFWSLVEESQLKLAFLLVQWWVSLFSVDFAPREVDRQATTAAWVHLPGKFGAPPSLSLESGMCDHAQRAAAEALDECLKPAKVSHVGELKSFANAILRD